MPAMGYKKDPDNKNHLVIDEYAAEIVRTIFNMKLDGFSAQNIAADLSDMGVLIPIAGIDTDKLSPLSFHIKLTSDFN